MRSSYSIRVTGVTTFAMPLLSPPRGCLQQLYFRQRRGARLQRYDMTARAALSCIVHEDSRAVHGQVARGGEQEQAAKRIRHGSAEGKGEGGATAERRRTTREGGGRQGSKAPCRLVGGTYLCFVPQNAAAAPNLSLFLYL